MAALMTLVAGCGLITGSGGSSGGKIKTVTARSGDFTIKIYEEYHEVQGDFGPEVEFALEGADEVDQVIVTRHSGTQGAENSGLSMVTNLTTSGTAQCRPLDKKLGGDIAWHCPSADGPDGPFERVLVASAAGDDASLLFLVQTNGLDRAEKLAHSVVLSARPT